MAHQPNSTEDTMYTAEDLARIAFESTGSNPQRSPRHGDRAAACAFVATQALEELEDLSVEDSKLLWETVLAICAKGEDNLRVHTGERGDVS